MPSFPKGSYAPLPKTYRAELLRRMLVCIQNGSYTPYLIKTAKFRLSDKLGFLATGSQQVTCTCSDPLHGFASLQLHEKSVAYSFCDFFEYLKETGLVYSKEESESAARPAETGAQRLIAAVNEKSHPEIQASFRTEALLSAGN